MLGDRRVRVERPHAPYFRYADEGQLVAREAASAPRTSAGRALARVRGVLFGRPLSIHEEIGERLSKVKALAIFSSDAISSSAYATEEILRVLVVGGIGAVLAFSVPVAIVNLDGLEEVAPEGLAAAQAAGVEFRLVRESTGAPTLMVGPVTRG